MSRYWQIYRPDFRKLLADGAVKAGAKIDYGSTVVDVDVEDGSLALKDGTTITADLIVCADGKNSIRVAVIFTNMCLKVFGHLAEDLSQVRAT